MTRYEDFFKNMKVDDIMEEYSDHHSEWKTLLITDKDGVRKFKHSNGNDYFCTQYNVDYNFNENIKKTLSGKTIEKQMDYYYVIESSEYSKTAYGSVTDEALKENSIKLSEYKGIIELLLKGDILVGAKIKGWPDYIDGILLPGNCACTYYASENEGSGTSD